MIRRAQCRERCGQAEHSKEIQHGGAYQGKSIDDYRENEQIYRHWTSSSENPYIGGNEQRTCNSKL
jgi:hypothetical protein